MQCVLNLTLPPMTIAFLSVVLLPLAMMRILFWSYHLIFRENMRGKMVLITDASSGIGEVYSQMTHYCNVMCLVHSVVVVLMVFWLYVEANGLSLCQERTEFDASCQEGRLSERLADKSRSLRAKNVMWLLWMWPKKCSCDCCQCGQRRRL